jgi:hypothetical protein
VFDLDLDLVFSFGLRFGFGFLFGIGVGFGFDSVLLSVLFHSRPGEVLRGIWKAGFPVGPFEAIENDSHNILVNLRIIYATNCGGYLSFTRYANRIRFVFSSLCLVHHCLMLSDPLSVGVASIEACVSGSFFKDYPLVHLLVGPIPCEAKKFQYIKTFFDEKAWVHIDDDKPIVCWVCVLMLWLLLLFSISISIISIIIIIIIICLVCICIGSVLTLRLR